MKICFAGTMEAGQLGLKKISHKEFIWEVFLYGWGAEAAYQGAGGQSGKDCLQCGDGFE